MACAKRVQIWHQAKTRNDTQQQVKSTAQAQGQRDELAQGSLGILLGAIETLFGDRIPRSDIPASSYLKFPEERRCRTTRFDQNPRRRLSPSLSKRSTSAPTQRQRRIPSRCCSTGRRSNPRRGCYEDAGDQDTRMCYPLGRHRKNVARPLSLADGRENLQAALRGNFRIRQTPAAKDMVRKKGYPLDHFLRSTRADQEHRTSFLVEKFATLETRYKQFNSSPFDLRQQTLPWFPPARSRKFI